MNRSTPLAARLLLLLLIVIAPLAAFFLLPRGGLTMAWGWLVFGLVLCLLAMWMLSGARRQSLEPSEEHPAHLLYPEQQPDVVRDVMSVRLATEEGGVWVFRGRLREPSATAYERLKQAFSAGMVPLLQEDDRYGAAIILMPKPVEEETLERPIRPGLHWLLLGLTMVTTTFVGAAHQGIDLLREPQRFAAGLPYALGLLGILGVHELGHYFAARRHGIRVTPPYFIPVPFALGTFGAFIRMRSPTENRRALFDVAVAGPLAGLVVAIPVLLIGLQTSVVIRDAVNAGPPLADVTGSEGVPTPMGEIKIGSSALLALLTKLALPHETRLNSVVQLGPLAFAGWLGIFITGLNLLPIGQLDGGHAIRGLFGHRTGRAISSLGMWSLLLLGLFVRPELLMWALIVFLIAGSPPPPLNDLTPLTFGRRWLGYFTFLLLLLILAPVPSALWSAAGIG